MKLEIITYNRVYKMKIAMPILIYALVIVTIVSKNTSAIGWLIFLKFATIIIIVGFGILHILLPNHKKKGSLVLLNNGFCSVNLEGIKSLVIIKSISLEYGGYNGEVHIFERFITLSNARDGTCNYITINDVKYQVLLNDIEDWNNIKVTLNALRDKGIRSNYVIMTFREILFLILLGSRNY